MFFIQKERLNISLNGQKSNMHLLPYKTTFSTQYILFAVLVCCITPVLLSLCAVSLLIKICAVILFLLSQNVTIFCLQISFIKQLKNKKKNCSVYPQQHLRMKRKSIVIQWAWYSQQMSTDILWAPDICQAFQIAGESIHVYADWGSQKI